MRSSSFFLCLAALYLCILGNVAATNSARHERRQSAGTAPRMVHARRSRESAVEKRAPAGGMTYQGCYPDNTRLLPYTAWTGGAGTTVESCTAACVGLGYDIAGMEYGNECYCGDTFLLTAAKVADTQCSMKCAGNSAQSCGASWRLSIYSASTPKVAVPATVKTTVSTFTSQGCYSEGTSGRILSATSDTDNAMTVEMCASFCTGYLYMGTEYGTECYCGNTLDNGGSIATSSTCNMACAGDTSELCGGPNRINVYKNTASAATLVPATPIIGLNSFRGCYAEPTNGRALTYQAPGGSSNTIETCRAACTAAGFSIAGMEYSNECWCGNQFTSGTALKSTSECGMSCSGNAKQFCGDADRLSVYSNNLLLTTAIPVAVGSIGNFVYAGCYKDDSSARTFPVAAAGGSVDKCAAACSNYAYFGVEFGNECYCGTTLGVSSLSASACNMPCSGSINQLCGGPDALNVYRNTKTVTSVPDLTKTTAIGCYADIVGNRSLTNVKTTSTQGYFTPAICATVCRASGWRYSGVEFGGECFCDNYLWAAASTGPAASSSCDMACKGDTSKTCGGSNRLTVTRDDSWVQTLFTVSKFGTWSNMGCYIDSTSKRTLATRITLAAASATVYTCQAACKAGGFKYCGLEYASECWGSNTAPTASFAPSLANSEDQITRGCNMPCNGNSGITCGGSDRITIFQDLGSGTTPVTTPVLI